jgi:hypothetical protein
MTEKLPSLHAMKNDFNANTKKLHRLTTMLIADRIKTFLVKAYFAEEKLQQRNVSNLFITPLLSVQIVRLIYSLRYCTN